jgi:3-hydroxyisobutyrate dehydrogenase
MKVGFAGLGIMGAPMASNLLKAGFDLRVYNRTASRCEPLVAQGAKAYATPAELAAESDVVIMIVSDTPDVEAVLFGENGLASGLKAGADVVDMSTISPARTVEFSTRLAEQGVSMLDAPVSGGDKGAIAGTLSIMVGGDKGTFDRCMPLFEAMGKKKAGLDPEKTLGAVGGGAAGSWIWTNLGPRVVKDDFAPGFMIKLQQKDLRLASELVEDLGMDAPGTKWCYELFTKALDMGLGDEGNQALYKVWKD